MSDEKTQIDDGEDFEGHQLGGGDVGFIDDGEDFEGHQLGGGEGMFEPQLEEKPEA